MLSKTQWLYWHFIEIFLIVTSWVLNHTKWLTWCLPTVHCTLINWIEISQIIRMTNTQVRRGFVKMVEVAFVNFCNGLGKSYIDWKIGSKFSIESGQQKIWINQPWLTLINYSSILHIHLNLNLVSTIHDQIIFENEEVIEVDIRALFHSLLVWLFLNSLLETLLNQQKYERFWKVICRIKKFPTPIIKEFNE